MRLKFKRKISKSRDNRSTVIVIPRAIAQSWEQYNTVELVFNGDYLMITPKKQSDLYGGERDYEQ